MKKIFSLTAVCILSAQALWAIQNIKLGGMEINPFVYEEGYYDDNIYLAESDKTETFYSKTSAGIKALQKLKENFSIGGGYRFEGLVYSKQQSANNAAHHYADIDISAEFARQSKLSVYDQFASTTDPANSELFARTKRMQNLAALRFEAPIAGNFGYRLHGSHVHHEYLDSAYEILNRNEYKLGGGLSYRVKPKTALFADYSYGNMKYQNVENNEAKYSNIDGGVIFDNITQKVSGMVKAGVQLRDYEKSLPGAENSATTLSYGMALKWVPQQNSEVSVLGERNNIESLYADSRYYTSTNAEINWKHSVSKFDLGMGVGYEIVSYPEDTPGTTEKRSDKISKFTLGADYNIQKWLKAGVSYGYKNRASNETAYEYADNLIGASIKAMF
ncbi:MAG: outer membrane beta-barrel protein [Elusimicrobia bacterium]|nr:outer membrane beta-barrel protein [Elusimicrobiota bacterium]